MKKNVCLILILFFYTNLLFSSPLYLKSLQIENIFELKEGINQIEANLFLPDKGYTRFERKAISLAQKYNNKTLLADTYFEIAKIYKSHRIYLNASLGHLQKAISIIGDSDNNRLLMYYSNESFLYVILNDLRRSKMSLDKASKLIKSDTASKYLIDYYIYNGAYLRDIRQNSEALQNLYKARNISKSLANIENSWEINNQIALIYLSENQHQKGLGILKDLLKKYPVKNSPSLYQVRNHINIGYAYFAMNQKASAEYFFKKALNFNYSPFLNYIVHVNLADLYLEQEKYQLAINHLSQAKVINENLNLERKDVYEGLAKVYADLNENTNALYFMHKAFKDTTGVINHTEKIYNLNLRYNINKTLKNYKAALKMLEDKVVLSNNFYNEEYSTKVSEMQAKYELQEKEIENELLSSRALIQELSLQRAKTIRYILIFGILTLVGFVFFIFHSLKNSKQVTKELKLKNRLIDKQKESIALSLSTQKILNNDLSYANNSLQKLFSIIAHDLRSPFNITLGYTEILVSDFDALSSSEIKKIISVIRKSLLQNYNLTQNLLKWVTSQTSGIRVVRKKQNIKQLITSCVEIYQELLKQKKITLNNDIENNLEGFVDENIVSTVLSNVINNAVKYSNDYGEIIVSASPKDKGILFIVSDNGLGIAKEQFNSIFDLNKFDSKLGTKNEKGTGIGLALCKQLVRYHNGDLEISSEVNKGTTIKFWLSEV